jgi:hypothetical protein
VVTLNPPAQYANDRNLRARQRFWRHQDPYFDIVGWVMDLARLSPGLRVLGAAFETVTCVRPASHPPVVIRDAAVAAGYLASLASHHQDETARPWDDVVEDVRRQVQAVIDHEGAFITSGDLAAFVCR